MLTATQSRDAEPAAAFDALVREIRPELHRYCARMVGSAVDAEDILQEALVRAYAALPATPVVNMRAWLFRIAHNRAVDHLRRASHMALEHLDEQALQAEPEPPLDERELVTLALSVFLRLAPKQRSCVILKDVMGYSLADISELLDATVPEIKAALHRGRGRLRELAQAPASERPAPRDARERELLARYVERFNARDFDGLRDMLADDVRLDLANRTARRGRAQVGEYFHRYSESAGWRLSLGALEGRPAAIVETTGGEPAVYAILIDWAGDQIAVIRDYRYAPYVMDGVEISMEG